MKLSADDLQMAVRDFFTPAQLLEFVDLPDGVARAKWGEQQFREREGRFTVRRLDGEPDAGALTVWTPAPGGFRYEVEASRGPRADYVAWREVHEIADRRMTAVRYGALREAVERVRGHQASYVACPGPYADPGVWDTQFYRPWSRRSMTLQLQAAAALDAILPAAIAHPSLF
ncbi:hypothetical protein [Streptomyces regalis]|uniref:Uncharacterized protein n=1 Tax=Streptomyces regalis TaxID=68262 RepID=A0A101JAI1_9ACTN|nr:hypothetical protein [Streptomyces regalis]KUL23208.1 hypothetical protein ADL12_39705 [Streptomyces regalis]